DLMSYGTFGAGYDGESPFHPSAFSKSFFNWLTLEQPAAGESIITLPPIQTDPKALKLSVNGDDEYFVIENRKASGFDAKFSSLNLSEGIYIWHIDATGFSTFRESNLVNSPSLPNGPSHHLVQVVEADGRDDL